MGTRGVIAKPYGDGWQGRYRWTDEQRRPATWRSHAGVVLCVLLVIILGWLMVRKGASTLTPPPPNNPCAIEMYHDGTWEPICHTKSGLVPEGVSHNFAEWPVMWWDYNPDSAGPDGTAAHTKCVEDDPCWNPQTMGNHQGAIK